MKDAVNEDADKKAWDEEIKRELNEAINQHSLSQKSDHANYENDMTIWKSLNSE